MRIPSLEEIVHEILPEVKTRLKAKVSVDYVDGDVWITYEEHKPDGSYGEPHQWKLKLHDE